MSKLKKYAKKNSWWLFFKSTLTRVNTNSNFNRFEMHMDRPDKNVVECYKEFFGYFNALETNGDMSFQLSGQIRPFMAVLKISAVKAKV